MPRRLTKQQKAEARVESGRCLTCSNKPQNRGLCFRCNAARQAAVARGETTDEELIAEGLLLPSKRIGRRAESGFAGALSKVKG